MFNTLIKNFQQQNNAQLWQQSLKNKVVVKNNYQATGDVKKAKAFVSLVKSYSFAPISITTNEQLIFSADVPLSAYF